MIVLRGGRVHNAGDAQGRAERMGCAGGRMRRRKQRSMSW